MIDDLVIFEKLQCEEGSAAAALPGRPPGLDQLVETYQSAGSAAHPEKHFYRSLQEVAWGVEVDGRAGRTSAPTRKVLAPASVTVQVLLCGATSAHALESLVASWVAVLLARRRALCLLEVSFDVLRGKEPGDVLLVSERLRDELLSLVRLAPMFYTNLRAPEPDRLYVTDASTPVSYTHLTLPTILRVLILSVAALSQKTLHLIYS